MRNYLKLLEMLHPIFPIINFEITLNIMEKVGYIREFKHFLSYKCYVNSQF